MSGTAAPPLRHDVELELEWLGDNRLRGTSGEVELVLDSPALAGPSPVQTLAFALAGCMAMDVLLVVQRGRYALQGLSVRLAAERAGADPRRLLRVELHFRLTGQVPPDRVERAIQLSRDKYCSVWHSLRTDIELATSFEIVPAGS